MKHIFCALAALVIGSASAQAEELLGYVNLNTHGQEFFVAAHLSDSTVTATIPLNGFFNGEQQNAMLDCMLKKTTHVIRVDRLSKKQIKSVRCVEAIGFLQGWREVVRNSDFR